jgi:phospholipase C
MKMRISSRISILGTALVTLAFGAASAVGTAGASVASVAAAPATPIKHLVVIFDENESFDHYFGTYPYAKNPKGEPAFHAAKGTPAIKGLYTKIGSKGPTGPLLTANPNGSNPVRIDRNDPMTCDQDHAYVAEQLAADNGKEDKYPENTGKNQTLAQCLAGLKYKGKAEPVPSGASKNFAVMDYYDGNTVTGLWNYAQHYALSDNNFGTTFGESTLGALNLGASTTYGAICGPAGGTNPVTINTAGPCAAPSGLIEGDPLGSTITAPAPQAAGQGTVTDDADPTYDICSYVPKADGGDGDDPAGTITMGGNNIGVELTKAKLTWGWFEGGFDNGYVPGHGKQPTTAQICSEKHENVGGKEIADYVPHHEPFQYFAQTSNPMHLPPSSVAKIGYTDQANHQYDIADFWAAAQAGNLPQVSFLKAPAYQDSHAGYSDPLDEQAWLADTINKIESLKTWSSTAIVLTWDDSDGWYDSVLGPLLTQSQTSLDNLTAPGQCGSSPAKVPVNSADQPEEGRCGAGPRLPLLVISPWAKKNFVNTAFSDQSSIDKFIEYNWHLTALGDGAADSAAGSLLPMFTFGKKPGNLTPVYISPSTGETQKTP